jgi:drug/metabolite transporter (DMT)-like permease
MLAILGGLGAAIAWATSSLASARSARMIGSVVTLGWVMLIGTAIAVPLALVAGEGVAFTPDAVVLLILSGAGNLLGLLFAYSAFQRGKVAVVAPILSTEGAMAAVIAVAFGEQLAVGAGIVLAAIVGGIILASSGGQAEPASIEPGGLTEIPVDGSEVATGTGGSATPSLGSALPWALAAVVCFGIGLYTSARIGATMPLVWSILPARIGGFVFVALPLLVTGRLRLTREAAPLVVIVGIAEIVGVAVYALGARDSIAIAAVMSSQFGAIAAVASVVLFGEQLRRWQVVGVGVITVGVALLAAITAT